MKVFDDFPDLPWGQRRGLIAPRHAHIGPNGERLCIWCRAALPAYRRRARACDQPKQPDELPCEAKLYMVTTWITLRQLIIERDNGRCRLCGENAAPYEVDHIRRVVDGGTDDPANLRTLCHACHAEVSGAHRWGSR